MVKRVKPLPEAPDTPASYDVGYGKPPKAMQFRKGRSGNPKGRPKGKRNLATDLSLALNDTVTVVEHGRRRTITKREAICRQLTNRSAGGDLAALSLLIPLLSQIDASDTGEAFRFASIRLLIAPWPKHCSPAWAVSTPTQRRRNEHERENPHALRCREEPGAALRLR